LKISWTIWNKPKTFANLNNFTNTDNNKCIRLITVTWIKWVNRCNFQSKDNNNKCNNYFNLNRLNNNNNIRIKHNNWCSRNNRYTKFSINKLPSNKLKFNNQCSFPIKVNNNINNNNIINIIQLQGCVIYWIWIKDFDTFHKRYQILLFFHSPCKIFYQNPLVLLIYAR